MQQANNPKFFIDSHEENGEKGGFVNGRTREFSLTTAVTRLLKSSCDSAETKLQLFSKIYSEKFLRYRKKKYIYDPVLNDSPKNATTVMIILALATYLDLLQQSLFVILLIPQIL